MTLRPWTEDEDRRLRSIITGGNSFHNASEALGRTRNACVGRAHRLGIASPRRPVVSARKRYLAQQKALTRKRLDAFAEALAEHGTIAAAAKLVGIGRQRGDQLFAHIRAELGWQAS